MYSHKDDLYFQMPRYIKVLRALWEAFERGLNPIFDEIREGVVCLPSEVIYISKTGVWTPVSEPCARCLGNRFTGIWEHKLKQGIVMLSIRFRLQIAIPLQEYWGQYTV